MSDRRRNYKVEELGKAEEYLGGSLVWRRHNVVLVSLRTHHGTVHVVPSANIFRPFQTEDGARNLHVCTYRHLSHERPKGVVVFLHGSCGDSRDHLAKAQHVVKELQMDAVLVDFGVSLLLQNSL